jgi:hypothetical protein
LQIAKLDIERYMKKYSSLNRHLNKNLKLMYYCNVSSKVDMSMIVVNLVMLFYVKKDKYNFVIESIIWPKI